MAQKAEPIPPLLASPRRNPTPAYSLLGLLAVVAAARLAMSWHISILRCSFKTLTGLPCATCGGTRSLAALSQLHFVEAFWFNPLVFFSAIGAALWFVACLILPTASMDRFKARFRHVPLGKIAIGAAILNWIFVLRFLPR